MSVVGRIRDAVVASDRESRMTAASMFLNFWSGVTIIWANKLAYLSGFRWALLLTCLHFAVTYLGLEVSASFGMFERIKVPIREVIPISAVFCGFVIFNNLSLQHNDVGLYQLLKVLTTPFIVSVEYTVYNKRFPVTHLLALSIICIGVILAAVSSITFNFYGALFGGVGVVMTGVYQIWVKTEQARLGLKSQQLLYYQAPVSAVMLLVMMPLIQPDSYSLLQESPSPICWMWVIISALLAFLVNLSIFLVIGRTSPVSYNVLGHLKLSIILTSGYVLFGETASLQKLVGVLLALVGIFWYTDLKLRANSKATADPKPAKSEEIHLDKLKGN